MGWLKSNALFISGLFLIIYSIYQIIVSVTEAVNTEILVVITPLFQIFSGIGLCVLSLLFSNGEDEIELELGIKSIKLKKKGNR